MTPNKLINEPKFRQLLDELWKRTTESGEENGALVIIEPAASTLHSIELSEGQHITLGNKTQYAPRVAAMPEIGPETRAALNRFRGAGRQVALFAFFHTHPNYASGGSGSGDPSGSDIQFQYDYGNPLGVIRTGSGFSFFSDGVAFRPGDAKADECIKYNPLLVR